MERYRAYTNSELRAAAEAAAAERQALAAPLLALPAAELVDRLQREGEGLVAAGAAGALLADLIRIRPRLEADSEVSVAALRAAAEALQPGLARQHDEAATLLDQLASRATERAAALESEQLALHELEGRLVIRAQLPELRDHVRTAQWALRAEQLVGRIPAVARSLTVVSKRASEQLLNADFERRFETERAALRGPPVQLEFPGRKGQATRRKSVAASHRLTEVLSEGEQKVIALADFLAEAGLRTTSAPLVFDDPVNSLDYKRLKYVVARIVTLSKHHQITVFTHNIWFTTELLAQFDKDGCSYYSVSCEGDLKGLLHSGTGPRSDSIKDSTGKINKMIQDAASLSGEIREALIERAYDYIRNWCEVVVETELLAKVTQRYQPNVSMDRLRDIKAGRLAQAIEVILPIFHKACRVIGAHSQPLEMLNVRPDLNELKDDWSQLITARAEYKAG